MPKVAPCCPRPRRAAYASARVPRTCSKATSESWGPGDASGWLCTVMALRPGCSMPAHVPSFRLIRLTCGKEVQRVRAEFSQALGRFSSVEHWGGLLGEQLPLRNLSIAIHSAANRRMHSGTQRAQHSGRSAPRPQTAAWRGPPQSCGSAPKSRCGLQFRCGIEACVRSRRRRQWERARRRSEAGQRWLGAARPALACRWGAMILARHRYFPNRAHRWACAAAGGCRRGART